MSDDANAIVDLTIAYTWALDSRSFEDLHHIFAADATADLAGVHCVGIDSITDRIQRALSPLDATQHLVSNHQVRIDGETATCRCYLVAQHVKRGTDGGENFVIAGMYHDRAARTADGWRITYRALETVWTDGNPAVVGR